MQRQSLGSPNSKLHSSAGVGLAAGVPSERDDRRKSSAAAILVAEEGDAKPQKPLRPSPDRSIHLIPVLTLVCILLLYLTSHDPSAQDLAAIERVSLRRDVNAATSTEVGGRVASAVGNHRRLKTSEAEAEAAAKLHHRKLGIR